MTLFHFITTVMSIATSNTWISNAMQMLMQTSTELYNHTINVALLTACIVREDEERSYDPYEVILGALLHDIGYAGTVNKSRGMPIDGMTDMEKMKALAGNGKVDAELLDMLYKRLGGISELLSSITSVLLSE